MTTILRVVAAVAVLAASAFAWLSWKVQQRWEA